MAGSDSVRAIELKRLARLGPFHWGKLAFARGAGGAAAVVLPLAIAGATGHVQRGAYMGESGCDLSPIERAEFSKSYSPNRRYRRP